MLGAGAPWAWGGCGTGPPPPPSHISPTARGEQRGAVPISTQGFYQPPHPPPVTTATVVSVYLPGEGRSAIEMGCAGARFVLWLGEERFPCNGFNGGFWGMERGGCPGRGARARERSRLPRADATAAWGIPRRPRTFCSWRGERSAAGVSPWPRSSLWVCLSLEITHIAVCFKSLTCASDLAA